MKFCQKTKKNYFLVAVACVTNTGHGVSISGNNQNPAGLGPGQPAVADLS